MSNQDLMRHKLSICPLCGEKTKRETREVSRKYKKIPFFYYQVGEWCDKCHEGFFSSEDLKTTREVREQKKAVIDLIESGEFFIKYLGFKSRVKYDVEAKTFYGEIIDSKAIIHSRGTTLKKVEKSFVEGVKAYLSVRKDLKYDRE